MVQWLQARPRGAHNSSVVGTLSVTVGGRGRVTSPNLRESTGPTACCSLQSAQNEIEPERGIFYFTAPQRHLALAHAQKMDQAPGLSSRATTYSVLEHSLIHESAVNREELNVQWILLLPIDWMRFFKTYKQESLVPSLFGSFLAPDMHAVRRISLFARPVLASAIKKQKRSSMHALDSLNHMCRLDCDCGSACIFVVWGYLRSLS